MTLKKTLRLVVLTIATAGTLAMTASPAMAGTSDMLVRLQGNVEVPGPGDPNGRGAAIIDLRADLGQVCAGVRFNRLERPLTGMHIHPGAPGVAGGIVVNLNSILDGTTRCVSGVDSALIRDIRMRPGQYYLNVHTEEFPNGAIRGQLNRSAVESKFTNATGPDHPFAKMSGAEEVPGPGDPDGRGVGFINLNAGSVCADVRWRSIGSLLTGMHIHRGAVGVAGPIVVGFIGAGFPGTRCVAADPLLIQEIRDNPEAFYLNVHTSPFPNGAIRGQLQHSQML